MAMQKELIDKILKLKKKKKAVILVHNYQRPVIYKIADFIGDSLDLSIAATETTARIIVFCGVDFMAESAKILNPEKKVLLPTKAATCPMAAMINATALRKFKKRHPGAAVVCYINTTAEVKAESDICCTSRNAGEIVNSLPNKQIIFVPDIHLAEYVQTQTKKRIIPWKGYCYVHAAILAETIKEAKKSHPKAEVIAHPESPMEVLKLADHVCGTGGMIKYAKQSKAKEFIVATEEGMTNRLKLEVPGKKFYPAAGVCFNQKAVNLKNVYESLNREKYEIEVPEKVRIKAKKALDRMLEISID
ncbi:MAG: quinolinate synthase NadA [Candidatus Omnitrophota bacterium]|nr:MAG: quinolinate synthase NadA [Candidatus Omnitrophota bacterium]